MLFSKGMANYAWIRYIRLLSKAKSHNEHNPPFRVTAKTVHIFRFSYLRYLEDSKDLGQKSNLFGFGS